MAQLEHFNFVDAAKRTIEGRIRETLTDAIVDDYLAGLRNKIEPLVRAEVDKYSVDAVERVKDLCKLGEDVHVFIHYREGGRQ